MESAGRSTAVEAGAAVRVVEVAEKVVEGDRCTVTGSQPICALKVFDAL